MKAGKYKHEHVHALIAVAAAVLTGGCVTTAAPTSSGITPANPHTVVNMPGLRESLEVNCDGGAIKECRVWGGNKFRKRYEYCGCRDLRDN